MTHAKTLFPVCGRAARLPEHLVREALRIATPYGSRGEADVERDLWCHLQVHGDGDHFAIVLDLDGVATGAIWTRWADGVPAAAAEVSLFDGHIACYPYSGDPRERTPYANVRVVDDLWLNNLTPEGLAKLAAQLRAQADHLEMDVTPILEEARHDWTARQTGRATHVLR